jgi:hypothetical protein
LADTLLRDNIAEGGRGGNGVTGGDGGDAEGGGLFADAGTTIHLDGGSITGNVARGGAGGGGNSGGDSGAGIGGGVYLTAPGSLRHRTKIRGNFEPISVDLPPGR